MHKIIYEKENSLENVTRLASKKQNVQAEEVYLTQKQTTATKFPAAWVICVHMVRLYPSWKILGLIMVHLLSHNEYKAVLNKNKKKTKKSKKNLHRSTRVYCPGRAYRSPPAYRLHERTVLYVRIELVLRLLRKKKKKETTTKKKTKTKQNRKLP